MTTLGETLVGMQQELKSITAAQAMKGTIAHKFILLWEDTSLTDGISNQMTVSCGSELPDGDYDSFVITDGSPFRPRLSTPDVARREGTNAWFDFNAPKEHQAYFDYNRFAGLIGGDVCTPTLNP
jgi:hypothetical protein